MKRLVAAVTVALLITVGLAGCGTKNDHDQADVTFARSMIPHHQQAVRMAKLVEGRTSDPQVTKLAHRIEAAQGPEITRMREWLDDWDESASGGHGGSGMSAMMSDADMTRLADASGPTFDRMFLTMMVAHHRGAIAMARTELDRGRNADAMSLARRIRSTQTAEIARMRQLLAG